MKYLILAQYDRMLSARLKQAGIDCENLMGEDADRDRLAACEIAARTISDHPPTTLFNYHLIENEWEYVQALCILQDLGGWYAVVKDGIVIASRGRGA